MGDRGAQNEGEDGRVTSMYVRKEDSGTFTGTSTGTGIGASVRRDWGDEVWDWDWDWDWTGTGEFGVEAFSSAAFPKRDHARSTEDGWQDGRMAGWGGGKDGEV